MKEVAGNIRTIHSFTIAEVGERYALELLSIAVELRSGKIKPDNFDMTDFYWSPACNRGIASFPDDVIEEYKKGCGTPCCILGHLRMRLNEPLALNYECAYLPILGDLFNANHPSDPQLAADAIERYVYDHDPKPWQPK